MNRTVLVVCGVLVVACAGTGTPAAAAVGSPTCQSTGTGTSGSDGCSSQSGRVTTNVDGPSETGYTVSKSVSPSGHVEPGQKVTYTLTVTAKGDAPSAAVTDSLNNVLDDAHYNGDAKSTSSDGSAGSVTYAKKNERVSWAGALTAGQTVSVTYSVTVSDPDGGDGVLRNDVNPSPNGDNGGTCSACAVTNAVAGTFTVAETSSPRPGASVHAGQTISYTVTVASGDAPSYAQVTDSLSAGLNYAGGVKASTGTVRMSGGKLHWSGHLDAGTGATITFAARVDADARQVRSTVIPVGADPYQGQCAASGSCELTHHLIAAPSSGPVTTPTSTPPPSAGGSQSAVALPQRSTTSTGPAIADTGAHTLGLGTLGAGLLLAGTGLLAAGGRSRRRARHGH